MVWLLKWLRILTYESSGLDATFGKKTYSLNLHQCEEGSIGAYIMTELQSFSLKGEPAVCDASPLSCALTWSYFEK